MRVAYWFDYCGIFAMSRRSLCLSTIFRFHPAGSEVSALLGRMLRRGCQPTLATEMGQLQERITSTNKGSVTSIQAIYVPADDYTDPAPATAFRPFGLNDQPGAQLVQLGIYPAVDPLSSFRALSRPSSDKTMRWLLRSNAFFQRWP